MIGGDEQALFENCFGQQGQQLILHEEVVYVPRQQLGGTGPALHCGFPLDAAEPDVTRPCPYGEEDVPDEEGSEWVKEIRIYGTGRSNWGSFKLTGRVRAFDGLVMLLKEYAVRLRFSPSNRLWALIVSGVGPGRCNRRPVLTASPPPLPSPNCPKQLRRRGATGSIEATSRPTRVSLALGATRSAPKTSEVRSCTASRPPATAAATNP